ncbi:hypothetical protein [Ideonella sp.]|uniref:hypothetical protein n=1 Tax=Ideonella sp. TaxID=1929293 RepID=UPI0035AD7844
MFDFSSLCLSPDQCRAARSYFGWPQARAAEESGLPIHKLKRFEAGNYIPDSEFLEALRTFYESRGFTFDDTPAPGASAKSAGQVFPAGVVGDAPAADGAKRYRERAGAARVHHMRIALQDEGEMGRALDLIEDNEEKLAELLRTPIESGFFGLSEGTKARHAEAVRLLAENGMLFARLFGRELGGKPAVKALHEPQEATTTGDLLRALQADAHLVAAGDPDAKERRKARKPAASLAEALGLN